MDQLEEQETSTLPTDGPTWSSDERRDQGLVRRFDRWLTSQGVLVDQPARTVTILAAVLGVTAAVLAGPIPALLFVVLTAALTHVLVRAAHVQRVRERDRGLASALENLVKGSHIGLPGEDELSRAFERAAREIEARVGRSVREQQTAVKDAENRMKAYEREVRYFKTRIEELEGQKREAEKAKSAVEAERETLEKILDDERAKLERHASTLESVREESERAVEAERGAAAEARSRVSELESELDEARRSAARSEEDLRARAAELEAAAARGEERLREASESHATAREELRAERDEARAAVVRLEAEIESVRVEAERASAAESADVRRERDEAERAVADARREVDGLRREKAEAEARLSQFRESTDAEAAALSGRVRELEESRRVADERMSASTREVEERAQTERAERGRAEARVRELETELAARRDEAEQLTRESEELRKRAAGVGETQLRFFDTVSGKLRGPVQIAARLADELAKRAVGQPAPPTPDGRPEPTTEIRAQLRRLDRLVEQLVDLSKLESPKWTAVRSEFNSRRMILGAMSGVSEVAAHRGVSLEEDLPIDMPTIRTDERLVLRALRELLANAIRFSRQGGRVRVSGNVVSQGDGSGDSVLEIAIRDEGPGVAPGDIDRIFLPFEQADDQPRFRTSEFGVGLGLTLARRSMELLGGRVTVESQPGRGSTFTLRAPVHVAVPA